MTENQANKYFTISGISRIFVETKTKNMQVIDKAWKYGTYKAYANVPAELLQFTTGCRVQPAPFVGKRQYTFYLIARYEPGENKYFPKGGFEVRGDNSIRYSFDLDQVILYQDDKVKVTKAKAVKKKTETTKAPKKDKAETTIVATTTIEGDKPVSKKVCGFVKKDGKPCQMKTSGGLCRHHNK